MGAATRKWPRLAAAGACGAAVGVLGPAAVWLTLALTVEGFRNERAEAVARLLAWTVGGFGLLPGLANGLVGGWYTVRGMASPPVWAVPALLPFVAWAVDRDNPKVGCTCFVCLVPSASVWLAGWVGAAVAGRRHAEPGAAADGPAKPSPPLS